MQAPKESAAEPTPEAGSETVESPAVETAAPHAAETPEVVAPATEANTEASTEAVAVPAEEPKEAPKETEQDKSVAKLEKSKNRLQKWVKIIRGKTHSNSANTAASAAPPATPVVAASA